MGNTCCNKKKRQKKVVLLLVGLDNAGKTVAAKGLAGESVDAVVPTVGFSVVNLYYKKYKVKVFDLGGGSNIRGIWHRYFVDAHGIIFVVDSSDYDRLDEAKDVLWELLSNEKISGKPVLLLANKQDREEALDEMELLDKLQLEHLVNNEHCPTLVESCSATDVTSKSNIDPGIHRGYRWILNYITRNYESLNSRVKEDVKNQEIKDAQERMEKMERLKATLNKKEADEDRIESYTEYISTNHSDIVHVKPIVRNDVLNVEINNHTETHLKVEVDVLSNASSKRSKSIPNSGSSSKAIPETRPKSASQLVMQQLRMENGHQKGAPRLSLASNKTFPANLYGIRHPQSATEQRRHRKDDRNLRSAGGTSVFFISNQLQSAKSDPQGDHFQHQLFQLNNFHKSRKLPPLVKSECRDVNKTDISIIDLN